MLRTGMATSSSPTSNIYVEGISHLASRTECCIVCAESARGEDTAFNCNGLWILRASGEFHVVCVFLCVFCECCNAALSQPEEKVLSWNSWLVLNSQFRFATCGRSSLTLASCNHNGKNHDQSQRSSEGMFARMAAIGKKRFFNVLRSINLTLIHSILRLSVSRFPPFRYSDHHKNCHVTALLKRAGEKCHFFPRFGHWGKSIMLGKVSSQDC
mmetsp:Transcript_89089/g.148617  ORF Transcript_89089/g.148617 Transcript_89089/m.148617 type:complete len:213 (+) Transcript_89089:719-1357(+)